MAKLPPLPPRNLTAENSTAPNDDVRQLRATIKELWQARPSSDGPIDKEDLAQKAKAVYKLVAGTSLEAATPPRDTSNAPGQVEDAPPPPTVGSPNRPRANWRRAPGAQAGETRAASSSSLVLRGALGAELSKSARKMQVKSISANDLEGEALVQNWLGAAEAEGSGGSGGGEGSSGAAKDKEATSPV